MPTQQRAPQAPNADEPRFERRPTREAPGTRGDLGPGHRSDDGAAAAGRRSWVSDVLLGSGLNLVAGAWLVVAPFVLGYATMSARWNDVVVGVAMATLAGWRLIDPTRTPQISWTNAALGLWLFGWSLWTFRSDVAMWNDIAVGGLVFAGGVISATATETRRPAEPNQRRGGSW